MPFSMSKHPIKVLRRRLCKKVLIPETAPLLNQVSSSLVQRAEDVEDLRSFG